MSLTVPMYGFGGGGGSELNFDVKDFRTEAELLASAGKENRIGVITPVPITSWRFDANKPEDLQEGEVWFSVGASSAVDFNALKKNCIQVYPISAKQHVSGALMDVEAKIHQNGVWVSLEETLLPPSTGWSFTKIFSNTTLGTCYFDGDVFVGSYSGSGGCAGIIKSIDFTDYKSIEVHYTLKNKDTASNTSPGYGGVILLVTDYDLNSNSNEIAAKWNTNEDTEKGFVPISTEGISGVHKFVAGVRGYTGTNINNEIRITKIKGVK